MRSDERKIYAILGMLEDDTVLFIHDLFEYSDNFKGATGSVHEAITDEYVEMQKDPDTHWDYFKELWQDAVAHDRTEDSLDDYIEEITQPYNYDGLFPTDAPSFRWQFDDAFKKLNIEQQQEILKAFSVYTREECVSMNDVFLPPLPDDLLENDLLGDDDLWEDDDGLCEADYMTIYNNCVGCGRCVGNEKLKVVFDRELLDLVASYEGINVDDMVTEDCRYA
jgi:hypothetical protein